MKKYLQQRITNQSNFKIYFCKFAPSKKKFKNNEKKNLKYKNRIIFSLFFFKSNFKDIYINFNNNSSGDFAFASFFIGPKSINFLYNSFNNFFFFFHNANINFLNFFLLKKKMETCWPAGRLHLVNYSRLSNFTDNLSFLKKKNISALKPKKLNFLSKYFFFAKRYSWVLLSKFKNNLVNFLLRSKKKVGVNMRQSVQDSAGYANDEFLFTNRYFFKLKSDKLLKIASYSTNRRTSSAAPSSLHKIAQPSIRLQPNFFLNKKFINLNFLDLILNFFFKPIVFKYFYAFFSRSVKSFFSPKFLFKAAPRYFSLIREKSLISNVFPTDDFSFYIKKYFLYITNFNKFNYQLMLPLQMSIIKFMQFCTGKRVLFKVYPYLYNILTPEEQIRCSLWSQKIKYYRKILGPKLFLKESLQIIYICLKYKDIHLFSNWTTAMFYKISFWKHKTFLRYLKYVLRYFFLGIYKKIEFKGIKFQLKGKISVAGNSRTRTSYHYVGFTSHSTFNNKILHKLNLVRTFTGVLGFKIWFVF